MNKNEGNLSAFVVLSTDKNTGDVHTFCICKDEQHAKKVVEESQKGLSSIEYWYQKTSVL